MLTCTIQDPTLIQKFVVLHIQGAAVDSRMSHANTDKCRFVRIAKNSFAVGLSLSTPMIRTSDPHAEPGTVRRAALRQAVPCIAVPGCSLVSKDADG